MYDIRQFKPTLYLLLFLGLTGFGIAAEQPMLWLLAAGALCLNAWLVRTNRFTPMPRWLSNGITLLATVFVVLQWIGAADAPILLIGQFLVLLHLVKLFEQRSNRDYSQLLVLSLLLMVSAAINTASLIFGLLFIGYLFVSLYCCLLFHLKVEADRAKIAQAVPPEKFNAATLRQDQRYLPRSMRRLTGLVSCISLACAVFVFLFFPRGSGAGMLGQLQARQPEVLTGFNEQQGLNEIARITLNNTPVATVQVWHYGKPFTNGELRLRGITFDRWHKEMDGEWEWTRETATNTPQGGAVEKDGQANVIYDTRGPGAHPPAPWRQVIRLDAIGAKALFALAGLRTFSAERDVKFTYWGVDETIQRQDNLNNTIHYEVTSTGSLNGPADLTAGPLQSTSISPELAEFAREAGGDAAARRPPSAPGVPVAGDEEIARNIEGYFHSHFTYTLDLTASAELFEGNDPLAVFVSKTKSGHCEFFAGAMTVACQSLGLRARMVAGFVTDEYNSVGQFFQVRQSHAHTWVEVLTVDHGWVTFDPTSGRALPPNETRSAWQRVRHVFDWLESKWAGSVIAYDGESRENIVQQLDISLMRTAFRGAENVSRWRRRIQAMVYWWKHMSIFDRANVLSVWAKVLAGAVTAMVFALIAVILWYLIGRRRIRRRAMRIGLASLPPSEQLRLARQLGFYEEMTELFARRRIPRPSHLTPREFGRSLTFLPTEAFNLVDRLTRIFYRVRYGGATIPQGQQHRLKVAVQRLEKALDGEQ